MKHRLDREGRLLSMHPPTFTHLHQRQLARSEAAAMTVLFPVLAWATGALDLEVAGADGEQHVDELAVRWVVQVVAFQVPK